MWHCLSVFIFRTKEMHSNLDTFDIKRVTEFIKDNIATKINWQHIITCRYYITNWLTKKSDVYSFGVVLLKIITNRPVIERSKERTHISQWVSSMLAKGDIENSVDPKLDGNYNVNSVWKAVEIAMLCLSPTSSKRPTMDQVVAELKECVETELAQRKDRYEDESKDSFDMININVTTALNPLAR